MMQSPEFIWFIINKALTNNIIDSIKEITCDYLQSIDLLGMPPLNLQLKLGILIILLYNLQVTEGLCNRTRLQVLELYCYTLHMCTPNPVISIISCPGPSSQSSHASPSPLISLRVSHYSRSALIFTPWLSYMVSSTW